MVYHKGRDVARTTAKCFGQLNFCTGELTLGPGRRILLPVRASTTDYERAERQRALGKHHCLI